MAKSRHPFQLHRSFPIDYSSAQINYYRSKRTGLSATLIQQKSPIVNGYFAVASEIHNDSGAPHTLEHLIFMGSQRYPFKGLLDTLGNKMLSSTNAWTGVDQTVYTLGTAGWDGFKSLLPVYIDHVMHPTLTDEACLTEVYHIDGNAEEKGVVFSEMQGVENTSFSRIQGCVQKALYGTESAYSSETGGLMGALRVLTNDQIQKFHKTTYMPTNLSIIVSGDVDPEEFLTLLQSIDDEMESEQGNYIRPFIDTEPSSYTQKSEVKRIDFPEVDESFGEALISWIGPKIYDAKDGLALEIILKYLTEEGIGKLSSALVEISDPLATSVDYYLDKYRDLGVSLYLSSVPSDKLDEAQKQVLRVIKNVLEEESIEMKQITRLLERAKDKLILNVETDPFRFAEIAISNFIYGDLEGKDLETWTATLDRFNALALWKKSQWLAVLETYLVNNPSVSILGKPSHQLYEAQRVENEERTKKYKSEYGESGLKKLQETLDAAQKKNNAPVPESVLNQFQAPDISKIKFIETVMAKVGKYKEENLDNTNKIQKLVNKDRPEDFNFDLHFEHFPSQFVTVHILLSTREIPLDLLPLVDVFFTELFALPLELEDGTILDFKSAIQKLKSDTLSEDIDYGISGQFDDYITYQLQVRCDKYHLAIQWIQNALIRAQFTEDRLNIILDKYLNGLSERKRSGSAVVRSSFNRTILTNRSVRKATDIFETDEYFKNLQTSFEDGNGISEIQSKLERARNALVQSHNVKALVIGDITKLKHPVKVWVPLANLSAPSQDITIEKIPYLRDVRSEKGIAVSKTAIITPMASSESSYVYVVCKGPIDFLHSDIPAISVCCEFLQAVEGPMWRAVRGAGLAYGANIYLNVEEGLIKLNIYRGTNAGEAIKVCKQLVAGFSSGETTIESHLLEGAKNSIVHSAATGGENAGLVAANNYLNYNLKGRERDHLKKHLNSVQKVQVQDVKDCFNKYFMALFDPESSMIFTACHTSMTDALKIQFMETGYEVDVNPVVGSDEDGETDYDSEDGLDDESDTEPHR